MNWLSWKVSETMDSSKPCKTKNIMQCHCARKREACLEGENVSRSQHNWAIKYVNMLCHYEELPKSTVRGTCIAGCKYPNSSGF